MIVALRRANPIRHLTQFIVLEYGYDIIIICCEGRNAHIYIHLPVADGRCV